MNTQTLIIVAIASIVDFIILYLIIQSATKSKQINNNTAAQLAVTIELALKSGVSKQDIDSAIVLNKQNKIKKATTDYNSGKISGAALQNIKEDLATS